MRSHPLRALAVAAATLAGCAAPSAPAPAAHDGPIVLITLEGLRADAVGSLGGEAGLTPNLDRLAAEASWAGRAVAASSWLAPAMASLLTGLKPWQHQVLTGSQLELGDSLPLLPEALAELGYSCRAYNDQNLLSPEHGYGRGFDAVATVHQGSRVTADLAALGPGRSFSWIHLMLPAPPYARRERLLSRLGPLPQASPGVVRGADLEPYFDPEVAMPPEEEAHFRALYRHNVAAADGTVGRMLRALAGSGQRPRTLIAVVAAYGQEFGEHGQAASGGNLGRALIEVPLILLLPEGLDRPLAVDPGARPSTSRLWATLVEAAGGAAPPGIAPSLFRPAEHAALSELYAAGPKNEISLVEGEHQLRWITPLPNTDGAYFAARRRAAASPRRSPQRQALRELTDRLERDFRASLPLSAGPAPQLLLERWTAQGTEVVDDPGRAGEMAGRLRRAWSLFVGEERSGRDEAALRPCRGLPIRAPGVVYSCPPFRGLSTGP